MSKVLNWLLVLSVTLSCINAWAMDAGDNFPCINISELVTKPEKGAYFGVEGNELIWSERAQAFFDIRGQRYPIREIALDSLIEHLETQKVETDENIEVKDDLDTMINDLNMYVAAVKNSGNNSKLYISALAGFLAAYGISWYLAHCYLTRF